MKNELINVLDKDELMVLIRSIDTHILLGPFKENAKEYSKYTSKLGRMDSRSQVTLLYLPGFVYELVNKGDKKFIDIISKQADAFKDDFITAIDSKEKVTLDNIKDIPAGDLSEILVKYYMDTDLDLDIFSIKAKLNGVSFDKEFLDKVFKKYEMIKGFVNKSKNLEKEHKEELKETEDLFNDKLKQQQHAYEKKIKAIAVVNDNLEDENEELKAKLKKLESSFDEMSEKYDSCNRRNELINEELNELKKDNEKSVAQVLKLKNELKRIEEETKQEWIWQMEREHETLSNAVDDLKYLRENIEIEYNDINSKVEKMTNDIVNLDMQKDSLQNDITILEKRNKELLEENEHLEKNIVDANSEHCSNSSTYATKAGLYVKSGIINDSCVEGSYDDYLDISDDNIEIINGSVNEDYRMAFDAAINANLIPTIYGYNSRMIVKAIVAARYGEDPTIISIPSGYNDIIELENVINCAPTKTVIIEDLFGKMNESIILPVIRERCQKKIFICCESEEQLRYVENYFYNYISLIKYDYSGTNSNEQFKYCNSDSNIEHRSFNKTSKGFALSRNLFRKIDGLKTYSSRRNDYLSYFIDYGLYGISDAAKLIFSNEVNIVLNDEQIEQLKDNVEKNMNIVDKTITEILRK